MKEYHWTPEQIDRLGWDDICLALEKDPDHMVKDGWVEVDKL